MSNLGMGEKSLQAMKHQPQVEELIPESSVCPQSGADLPRFSSLRSTASGAAETPRKILLKIQTLDCVKQHSDHA